MPPSRLSTFDVCVIPIPRIFSCTPRTPLETGGERSVGGLDGKAVPLGVRDGLGARRSVGVVAVGRLVAPAGDQGRGKGGDRGGSRAGRAVEGGGCRLWKGGAALDRVSSLILALPAFG